MKQTLLMLLLCGAVFCGTVFCGTMFCGTMPASSHDARKLQEKCVNAVKSADVISHLTSAEQADIGFCEGYVSATLDTMSVIVAAQDRKACKDLPEKPVKEIIPVVLEYLKQHPDQLSEPGMKVVLTAVVKAFGCS
jgi:Rap1a immunity proteins